MLLLLWMWWEVSGPMAALCSQLERCPMCFLCPPSHFLPVSLPPLSLPFFTSIACFSLSTLVRKEVCHVTCVFALAGMCVWLLQMSFTGSRNSSETPHNELSHQSQLWVFIHTSGDVIISGPCFKKNYQQEIFLSDTQKVTNQIEQTQPIRWPQSRLKQRVILLLYLQAMFSVRANKTYGWTV